MFCALSGISLSWTTLVFVRFTSQERTNVHRDGIFLHTRDFSLSKVTAIKVVWGKDTSRRSKEPASDFPTCFSAWAPFCKCGWHHHISRSGCGPDCCKSLNYKRLEQFFLKSLHIIFIMLRVWRFWDRVKGCCVRKESRRAGLKERWGTLFYT